MTQTSSCSSAVAGPESVRVICGDVAGGAEKRPAAACAIAQRAAGEGATAARKASATGHSSNGAR